LFNERRIEGMSLRQAIVTILTDTAKEQRKVAAALDRMIESRPSDPLAPAVVQTLWFSGNAAEAVEFYLSIFKNGWRDGNAGKCKAILPGSGEVATGVQFTIDAQDFVALDVAPRLRSSMNNVLTLRCYTQEEIDYYWEKLSAGGRTSRAGWLTDRFGVQWHIIPSDLPRMLRGKSDSAARDRVLELMQTMEKLNAAALFRASEFE
jgi:predicted 3-demethylubiquinone-9 3-methyltransferase (glyoxalase superfamily)